MVLAEAVWDHVAMEPEELGFRAGEVVEVLDTLDRDWWWGTRGDQAGWFPSAFVRVSSSLKLLLCKYLTLFCNEDFVFMLKVVFLSSLILYSLFIIVSFCSCG